MLCSADLDAEGFGLGHRPSNWVLLVDVSRRLHPFLRLDGKITTAQSSVTDRA